MPAITPARIAVADANVLINLIHVQQLGMLASLPGYEFVVTDDVIWPGHQRQAIERLVTRVASAPRPAEAAGPE